MPDPNPRVMAADGDAVLQTLLLPFMSGALSWPEQGGVLFLRARHGWPLHQQAWPGLVCEQSFKPEAQALQDAGLALAPADTAAKYALVLLLTPRQRDESRALMARALASLTPGGRVVACAANNAGARSAEDDLRRIAGPLGSLSKHKCRVFWTAPQLANAEQAQGDPAFAAQWLAADAPRTIGDDRFVSRPGVFAWDRIDPASALLAGHLPGNLTGRAADLGAGFGYLSVELLERCPGIAALDLYEAETRALDLARCNLAPFASGTTLGFHWHDVTTGLAQDYDVIVSNPPFHTRDRADRPDIGRRFIAVAAQALRPGGCLWLVANRHLPYEAVLTDSFGSVRTVAQRDGFKIVEAIKATRTGARPDATFDKAALRKLAR